AIAKQKRLGLGEGQPYPERAGSFATARALGSPGLSEGRGFRRMMRLGLGEGQPYPEKSHELGLLLYSFPLSSTISRA
ncbi:MAG: hypothetical protein ACLFT5_10135, partial [Desulfovermiculus sp.]